VDLDAFEERKRDHIHLALEPRHQAQGQTGLDGVRLIHEALPDFDLDQVMLSELCLGQSLPTPFFVAAMTAGHPDAAQLNFHLAEACSQRGWALGVGSQRRELSEEAVDVDHWKRLRDEFPQLMLFGNIGITQLGTDIFERLRTLAQIMGAQGWVVHLNSLQEAVQEEGTPFFAGASEALASVVQFMDLPVVVKETGCGISGATALRLMDLGVAAIDVSGLGGTHWGRIEGSRGGPEVADLASTFQNWGISTVDSVREVTRVRRSLSSSGRVPEIWASGGVRTGLDAAKLVAMGSHRVGFAQPALRALKEGRLLDWMEQVEREFQVALFCTGCQSPSELRESNSLGGAGA